MRLTTIAILASAFLVTGAAEVRADSMGEPTEADAKEAHAEVDENDDGMVDREEFYHRMVEIFYHNDVDKNGYLDLDELRKMQEEMVYDPADENHDGKLTMAEYIDQRFEAYHRVDTNSDGLLSVEEVVEAYESR
jgi:Ca2+-binding EF-hand superfamily protein